MKLMTQRKFSNNNLCSVSAIKAVDAVDPCNAILHPNRYFQSIAVMEKTGGGEDICGDILENAYYVLIGTVKLSVIYLINLSLSIPFGCPTHVPGSVQNLLIFR